MAPKWGLKNYNAGTKGFNLHLSILNINLKWIANYFNNFIDIYIYNILLLHFFLHFLETMCFNTSYSGY